MALPILRRDGQAHLTGLSPRRPGATPSRCSSSRLLAMQVPDGLPDDHAALTEPMAVGLHAVRRGEVGRHQTAVVVGCGPIGLAVVSMLKATGVRTVVASDPSPGRRRLAEALRGRRRRGPDGAGPLDGVRHRGYHLRAEQLLDLAVDSMARLRSVPGLPWWHVMRLAEAAGAMPPGRWSSSASACPG